jgi:hypothetical protein
VLACRTHVKQLALPVTAFIYRHVKPKLWIVSHACPPSFPQARVSHGDPRPSVCTGRCRHRCELTCKVCPSESTSGAFDALRSAHPRLRSQHQQCPQMQNVLDRRAGAGPKALTCAQRQQSAPKSAEERLRLGRAVGSITLFPCARTRCRETNEGRRDRDSACSRPRTCLS